MIAKDDEMDRVAFIVRSTLRPNAATQTARPSGLPDTASTLLFRQGSSSQLESNIHDVGSHFPKSIGRTWSCCLRTPCVL